MYLKIRAVQAGSLSIISTEMRVASKHRASCVHLIMSASCTDPLQTLSVEQMNILKHAESVLEFIGWDELLSAKKRLLNLSTSWAVITEGKATGCQVGDGAGL